MVQDLVVNKRLVIPAGELQWRFSRASGPGGQGVNTTDSRVELLLDLEACSVLGPVRRARLLERLGSRLSDGCLRVVAAEERSQWQNRQAAMARLSDLLREGLKPPPPSRKATRPGRGAVKRRLEAKKKRGDLKRQRRNKPTLEE
ncbi:alternative ribosome rescue aminoacyl-tRNA hydrolase ArfB [Synechococcus sp. A15-127]|jgi:ribosome-associated protein|uniref:alternative ribosome rescue aminoacyl-tRNA hydrolase ArfB n=1 Tax=Synechococcus sp. A15-127 TaxID=1050624 RepID=UPI0016483198|nr:alternative ribosome rescue aminoacyl-tRNA hydrolase ArfB [Synechococcus sp. A15-127]